MKATIIIITLAMIQIAPLFVLISSESNFAKLIGFIYGFILAYIWTETKLGKEFIKVLYKCTLHLEKKIFGSNADCWYMVIKDLNMVACESRHIFLRVCVFIYSRYLYPTAKLIIFCDIRKLFHKYFFKINIFYTLKHFWKISA